MYPNKYMDNKYESFTSERTHNIYGKPLKPTTRVYNVRSSEREVESVTWHWTYPAFDSVDFFSSSGSVISH